METLKKEKSIKELYSINSKIELVLKKSETNEKQFFGKTPEGIICLVDKNYNNPKLQEYSTWDCIVKSIFKNVIIIKPLELLTTATSNKFEMLKKLQLKFKK